MENLLEVSVNSFKGALNAEERVTKYWNIGEFTGLQAMLEQIDGDNDIDYRVIMVDNRQYQLVVAGPKGTIPSAESEKFFKSFKLSK